MAGEPDSDYSVDLLEELSLHDDSGDESEFDSMAPPIEYPPTIIEEEKEKMAKKAALQRAQWKKQGQTTREQYCRLSRSVSREVQDEIVRLRRGGETRKRIQEILKDRRPAVTEYAVKRVLRVFSYDPDAFDDGCEGITVVRK